MAFRHSTMTLYSDQLSVAGHCVRIAIAEKGIATNIVYVDKNALPADLLELNPYGSLPTLVDRDLMLYETSIIAEYLDERFPHPPLLPVYPILRAKCRLIIHRIEQDWLTLIDRLEKNHDAEISRKELRDQIITIAPIFNEAPYFLSEDFTLTDCYLAPIFWRLKSLSISIPNNPNFKSLYDYMNRVFTRESFKASLSSRELELA